MSVLLRGAELVKRPVVTLAGEDVAQIKDVVYTTSAGELAGFTLSGRGLFSGPLHSVLPWSNVHGLGPDAVIIADESALVDRKELAGEKEGAGGRVLGSRVMTDDGRELGLVTDLVLSVQERDSDAVGYEIEPAGQGSGRPRRQFVPLPDTLAVSGEALMLPAVARDFVRDDLAGFGAAVEEFRELLRSSKAATPAAAPAEPAQQAPDVEAPAAHGPPAPEATHRPAEAGLAEPVRQSSPRPLEGEGSAR